jgi:hypothetical protein
MIAALSVLLIVASIGSANSLEALTYAGAAAMVLLVTNVTTSGVPLVRRTATAQAAIGLTLAGALVMAPYAGSSVDVAIIMSGVVTLSLILGLVADQQISGLVRFVMLAGAVVLISMGLISLATWRWAASELIVSGASVALAFVGSWVRDAAEVVFKKPIDVRPLVPERAPTLPRPRLTRRARRLAGVLGAVELSAIAIIRLGYRMVDGAIVGAQRVLNITYRACRGIERRIRRMMVRLGQIVREDLRLVLSWLKRTVTLLDDRLLPAAGGAGLFLGTGVAACYASIELSDYAGSGNGFSGEGWLALAGVVALICAALIGFVLACATYGDDYVTAIQSVGNFFLQAVPIFVVMASFTVLGAVIGLPVLSLLPVIGEGVSSGPYELGPATAVSLGIFAAVALFVVLRWSASEVDSSASDDATSYSELLRRLFRSLRELEAGGATPVIMVTVAVSLAAFFIPALFLN